MHRILIIDDEPQFRTYVRGVLERIGYGVIEAGNGIEGVRLYGTTHPDLVLCDVFMPKKDGLETIRELLKKDPNARIIAVSGGDREYSMDFLPIAGQFGAISCLYKPFKSEDLLQLIDQAFASVPPAKSEPEA